MLTVATRPGGVMDAGYAEGRARKAHLAFRLRVRAQVVVAAVRRYGPAGPIRLLEVGAAEGRTLLEMARSLGDGQYVGIEYDDGLRSMHPELPSNVRLIFGDAMALPSELGEASFDVVSMLALLEHVRDPLIALAGAWRVLKPGGLLVATCPNPAWDGIAGRLGMVDGAHHVEQIDLRRLSDLIRQCGFEILEARRFMWAPVAVLPYVRIPVSPGGSLRIDGVVARIPPLRKLCTNAYVVARRAPAT
ncbi:MAG: class I SAM-dependent methyltransferase [Phycisphaerales bacterium]|nr:MAG: class I SAM-dependent methyltransferase [Phycisphaerales bacterium]